MRQWIEICIVPILVSVAVAHSGNTQSNSSNKKNICEIAKNLIEQYKVSFPPRKDTCQCGELSSVEVVGKSGESIINYQKCSRCSDNRPAGVNSEFCNPKNGNGFNAACLVRAIPCVGDSRISVCCQGNPVTIPTQPPTQPPTTTQAPTQPPTTTQATTTTTVCVPDANGWGCFDDGDLRK